MPENIRNRRTGSYYASFNKFINRFLVFDHVFKEFFETSHRIESGDCLSAENLDTLILDWHRNIINFEAFITHEIPTTTLRNQRRLHTQIKQLLQSYLDSQLELIAALDPLNNTINHFRAQPALLSINECRKNLNSYLRQLTTVSFG